MKKGIKIAVGIVALAGLGVGGYSLSANADEHLLTVKEVVEYQIEYGDDISTDVLEYFNTDELDEDHISSIQSNAIVEIEPEYDGEYPSIGNYTVDITYEDEKINIPVTVADTTDPTIIIAKIELEYGIDVDSVDWSEYVTVEDVSEITDVEYNYNDIDTSVSGNYTFSVKAKDSCGNVVDKYSTVTVKEQVVEEVEDTTTAAKSDTNIATENKNTTSSSLSRSSSTTKESTTPSSGSSSSSSSQSSGSSTNDGTYSTWNPEWNKTGEGEIGDGGTWESYDTDEPMPDDWNESLYEIYGGQ